MKDIPTISIKNYICGNCDQLKDGLCLWQDVKRQGDDVACSQIYDHYIGEK